MYGEQDKEKKPQSDVMVDREKLKDLEVKKRKWQLFRQKIAKDQETLAKMQIADKQAKDRKKDESVDEISENLEKFIKTNLDKIGVEYKHDYRQGTKTHIVKIDPKDHQKVTKALKHKLLHLKILVRAMDGTKIARNPNRTYKNKFSFERKLTDAEKDKLKKYEKDIDMKDFIDRYGEEEGKSIYYATLTKMAKGEGLWDNIRKKKARIARGSGERMRKKGEKGAPTAGPDETSKNESIDEINVPAILKSVISRMTHPKGYAKMLQTYIQKVKDDVKKKHSNRFHAAEVATMFGLNSVFPLIDYINKLVKKGQLPTSLMAQYEVDESLQLDEKIEGLVNKSKQTGVPYSILKKSYDRGMAAWKGGHRPGVWSTTMGVCKS